MTNFVKVKEIAKACPCFRSIKRPEVPAFPGVILLPSDGMLVDKRLPRHYSLHPRLPGVFIRLVLIDRRSLFVLLGDLAGEGLPKNTTQRPRSELEPGPLDPESPESNAL